MHSRLRDRLHSYRDLACYAALAFVILWGIGGVIWIAMVGK